MKILQPFIITILNKQEIHPLQAASNHSGEKMVEMINNTEYTPTKRSSVVALNELVLPPKDTFLYTSLPEFLQIRKSPRAEVTRNTRNTLWLRVNWREKRAAGQFSRQFELALPTDIPLDRARAAVVEFAQNALISEGMIADLAIHETRGMDPSTGAETVASRTAYLLCTTRPFVDGDFANKNRDWNDRNMLMVWRQAWFDALLPALPLGQAHVSQGAKDLIKFATRFASRRVKEQCLGNSGPEAAPHPPADPQQEAVDVLEQERPAPSRMRL